MHKVKYFWGERERVVRLFTGEWHPVFVNSVRVVDIEYLDMIRKSNHTAHWIKHILLPLSFLALPLRNPVYFDIITELSEVDLLIEHHLFFQQFLALFFKCLNDSLVFSMSDLAAEDWLTVRNNQVADINGIANRDLGIGSVYFNAVFYVRDQFLTPAYDHGRPVYSHVFYKNLNQAFFIDQYADGVLSLWVCGLQIHWLKVAPVIKVLLQLLSLNLQLSLTKSIQTLLVLFALLLLFPHQNVNSELVHLRRLTNRNIFGEELGAATLQITSFFNLELSSFLLVVSIL